MMTPDSGSISSERRRAPRFRIDIRVELEEGMGLTRDVSLSGVYFETEQLFAPGEQVSLIMVLERVSAGRPIRLQCEGRVVRVSSFDKRTGVAVAISGYRFGPSGRPIGLA